MFSPLQVHTESVANMIIRRLEELGVTRIFGVPGGACSALDDAALESKIEVVVCAHETIAGYMAMGYHLATGLPGVVVVTSGPGVLNVTSAIAAAKTDEAGLLVLAGDVARPNACRGALQDGGHAGLDLLTAIRPLSGLAIAIDRPEQASIRIEQAIHRCTQSPRGPAFVQIPIDVQNAVTTRTSFYLPPKTPGKAAAPSIAPALSMLQNARNPLILAGLGVRRAGASQDLVRLAESSGIPVMTDAEGLGAIPVGHPLHVGTYGIGDKGAGAAWLAHHETDVLFVVGARLDDTTTNGFSDDLGKPFIIQLDYDHRRLARAYPADVAMCGDLKLTLQELEQALPKVSLPRRRLLTTAIAENRLIEQPFRDLARTGLDWEAAPSEGHDPRVVASILGETFGEETTFVSDIGNHLLAMLRHHDVTGPDRFHFSLGLGGMGSGIGMAMGMAAAGAERVVAVCGDGGALMFGNDVATCAKYNIPLVMVVFNDGHFGMVQHGCTKLYGRADPLTLHTFSVTEWAKSLGATAWRVDQLAALKDAADWQGPGPLVLEVPIDKNVTYPNPRAALFKVGESGPDFVAGFDVAKSPAAATAGAEA